MLRNDAIIVCIDDSLQSLRLLLQALKKIGFDKHVIDFTNPVDGYGFIAKQGLIGKKVDLIISDMDMPYMTGLDVLRKVKSDKLTRDIPFIMLTKENDHEKVLDAIQLGVSQYLIKPVDPFKLADKIKKL